MLRRLITISEKRVITRDITFSWRPSDEFECELHVNARDDLGLVTGCGPTVDTIAFAADGSRVTAQMDLTLLE